jgi:hypothetical protein
MCPCTGTDVAGVIECMLCTECCAPVQVHLNPKEKVNVEGKVDTFASVYKNLCKKDVVFEFPVERE